MATDFAETCSVCTDEFDKSHRQSVSLPCGHDFCLSCLVRLRSKSEHKCPRCRRNWAKIALPMEALPTALESDQDYEEDDMDKKKDKDDRCKKHSSPYDFWVNAKKEFYCRKCAAEDKSGVELTIIEEAVPQIQAALAADVPEAKKRLEDGLESLDEKHANLVKNRNSVRKLIKAAKALEGNFDQEIEQVAAQRTRALTSSTELKKVEKKIPNITSPADLGAAIECKNTLKRVGAPSSVPASALPQTLLSNIACSYEEGATSESPPSKASFVNALLKGSPVGPLTEKEGSTSSSDSDKGVRSENVVRRARFSSDVKMSRKKDKSKARNESKHRNKLHINDKDEEGRNENIGRSTRSSEILPAKSRIQYKWQYEDDHGWTTYGQIPSTRNSSGAKTATSDDIERHYLDAEDDCPLVIEVSNVEYLLDFKELTQTNKWTKKRRNIRRIHKHTADDHSILGQTNYSLNSSEKTYSALGNADVTIPRDPPNNYSKYRSSDTSTNDFSVKHEWQFEDELGNWVTYGKTNPRFGGKKATTSEEIEKVFAKDPSRAIMRIHGKNHQYILDFRKGTQTNVETQVQRRVRRVPENSARTSLVDKPTAGSLVGSGKEFINFEWQFMDEHGQWITYGQINSAGKSAFVTTTTSDDIEKFFSSAPKKMMTIKSRTNDYVLNFLDMTQINETTSVVRPIRRIPKFSRENKPQNNVGHAAYRNITPLNLASSNPNSTPSYGITPSHGGSWLTTGQGSGSSDYGQGGGGRGASFNDYGQGGGGDDGRGAGSSDYGGGRGADFNNYGQGGGGGRGAGFDHYGEGGGNRRSGFSDYGQGGRGAGFNNYGQGGGGRGVGSNDYYGQGAGNTPGQSMYGNTFKWQFEDENGLWITYGQTSSTGFVKGKTSASSDDIERHYVRTSGQQLRISSPMGDYVLDFANMIQSNVTSRTKKRIRRVPLNYA